MIGEISAPLAISHCARQNPAPAEAPRELSPNLAIALVLLGSDMRWCAASSSVLPFHPPIASIFTHTGLGTSTTFPVASSLPLSESIAKITIVSEA